VRSEQNEAKGNGLRTEKRGCEKGGGEEEGAGVVLRRRRHEQVKQTYRKADHRDD
jgi:hypothetical protein